MRGKQDFGDPGAERRRIFLDEGQNRARRPKKQRDQKRADEESATQGVQRRAQHQR